MQTNVWPTMRWHDYQLQWNPQDYGNIKTIRVPPDKVWLPDIVLFNNADGNYEVSFYSNVVIEHTGEMLWVPPAIYKSSCTIDVEYFPFDEQVCAMIFGSWTFNQDEVTIKYLMGKRQVELNDYSPSGIWDVMEVPGELIQKKSKIAYQIKIRRKTLFYTMILIIPTVLMAFLSMMVFYLPAEASEKITLAISILLALVVFLLLVSKILPPTSSTIPLMAKYLLMTFVMNIITIVVTVIIINVYFRGPTTHSMPMWVKSVFLGYLPLFLMMQRPHTEEYKKKKRASNGSNSHNNSKRRKSQRSEMTSGLGHYAPGEFIEMNETNIAHHPYCSLNRRSRRPNIDANGEEPKQGNHATHNGFPPPPATLPDPNEPILLGRQERFPSYRAYSSDLGGVVSEEAVKAIDAIEYITEHLRKDNQYKRIREEWKYVSMVIDRLLLYVFFAVTVGGTCGIFLSAPNVFDNVNQTAVIEQLKRAAEAEMVA
uniref:Neur_chan_LBD domain-containing protein n=1 Tax=Panagrellus redivivus TaxID=6233 RepID=A0A7E4W742_PANRE